MNAAVTIESVSPSQVMAAREYIRRIGNADLVSERIVDVANLSLADVRAAWARRPWNDPEKIQAAQLLIEVRGGEEHVAPWIVELAHATPAAAEATVGR